MAIALAAVPACSAGIQGPQPATLTPQEVETNGTGVFRASSEQVFKACVEALQVLGYELAVEREDKGLIITKRKLVRDVAVGRAVGGPMVATSQAVSLAYYRQYTLEIRPAPDGSVRVVATPAVFENAVDISAQPVWDLDSPGGERALWQQLFTRIRSLI